MSDPQFLTLALAAVGQIVLVVWWGATLTAAVKRNMKDLFDHEVRLRQVEREVSRRSEVRS